VRNGTYPTPQPDPSSSRVSKLPGPGARMRTRWRHARLEEELARGTSPTARAELTLRAAPLSSQVVRSRLLGALVRRLHDARQREPDAIKRRWAERAEIRDCADDLLALARRLCDRQPGEVRGAAMTARLLSDKSSPSTRKMATPYATRCAPRLASDATDPTAEDLAGCGLAAPMRRL
jgi:hypothetical protein